MAYIIDTSAWIEYLKGSNEGKRAIPIIESNDNLTPTIVLAEMKNKFVEWNRNDFDQILEFIHRHSRIVDLDEATAIMAGEFRAKCKIEAIEGIGLVDCILVALARIYQCKVLTNDSDFSKLPEAAYLKRSSL